MSNPNRGLSNGKPKLGLFSGGIETYWKDTAMDDLPGMVEHDIARL
jgi:hypothetical protein